MKAFLFSKPTLQENHQRHHPQRPCTDLDCSKEQKEELKSTMLQLLRLLTNVETICAEENQHQILCRSGSLARHGVATPT